MCVAVKEQAGLLAAEGRSAHKINKTCTHTPRLEKENRARNVKMLLSAEPFFLFFSFF